MLTVARNASRALVRLEHCSCHRAEANDTRPQWPGHTPSASTLAKTGDFPGTFVIFPSS
jgi:hypothetical protein